MPEAMKLTRLLLSVLFTLGLGACASPQLPKTAEMPYPLSRPPLVGEILHLPTGTLVSESQMLQMATDTRIVYVGETHDNPASHRLQLGVLKAMAERYPGKVALGMEMLTPAQQQVLDRWVAGELSEKDFLKESEWYTVWRHDYELYRDLFEFARDHAIPVIGLNAEKRLVRSLGAGSAEALTEEEQAKIPVLDLDDPYQKAMTRAFFGGHPHGDSDFEGFHRTQTLWDETMASNVAAYLGSGEKTDRRMVVIAGGNHVRYGFGIPRRVFRRLPVSYTIIGDENIVIPESKRDRLMHIELPSFPMPPSEFVVFTEYEDLGIERVTLGIAFEDSEGVVTITGVLPGSNAERAGLAKGDILKSFDGEAVADGFDVIYPVKQKRPGDPARLVIERDGAELEIGVEFEAPAAGGHHGR